MKGEYVWKKENAADREKTLFRKKRSRKKTPKNAIHWEDSRRGIRAEGVPESRGRYRIFTKRRFRSC